ncbi:MAG: glycosyltransferase family 2 protein [Rhizobiales bacterium]|nr:glycosyltransferase family 2 protein [Hyphomicrobiales bacterium]
MSRPAVSIVIPLYNAASFITETLRSVQAQICSDFEVIVVDDGSRDRSAECVAAVAREDSRIRLHRQGNAGVSVARNRGAELAAAPVIAFLDADDLWHATFLSATLAFMAARPDVSVCHAGVRFVDAAGVPTGALSRLRTAPLSTRDLLAGNPTTTCSNLVVRRADFLASGGFPVGLNHAEDQLWLLSMHLRGHRIAGLADVLVDYRTNAGGLSADTRAMAQGFEALVHHAVHLAPLEVGPAVREARALNRLYLAQRAWRTRRDRASAAQHIRDALRSHWPTVSHEAFRLLRKALT